ncbi:MAG: TnsA endonuclease N-terminal domain-containing protein, partial [Candidatus Heimdallarchaeota archaeon]
MAELDWSAVRKVPPKTRGNRGIFKSSKNRNGFIEYESQIERDLFLLAQHAPDVITMQHQPCFIPYQKKNVKGTQNYPPDAGIEFRNGFRLLVEVKDESTMLRASNATKQKWESKWEQARRWAEERGQFFVILTDREIRTPRIANVWFTLGSSKCRDNKKYVKPLIGEIPRDGARYDNLCLKLAETIGVKIGKASQVLSFAIYHGLVFVDTFSEEVLSKNTVIRRRQTSIDNFPFKPLWEEYDWQLEQKQENSTKHTDQVKNKQANLKPLSAEFSSTSEEYEDEVKRLEKICVEWLNEPNRTKEWRNEFIKKWGIPERTMYRYAETYEAEKRPGLERIAHRERKAKKTDESLEVEKLMEIGRKLYLGAKLSKEERMRFGIKDSYKKKEFSSLRKAHRKLGENCKKYSLHFPSRTSFYDYIRSHTSAEDEAYFKRGSRYHQTHFSPSLAPFQGAIMPMQVLQMDNTPPDVHVVDSHFRQTLSPTHLTAAIDCCTGLITGFELSLYDPSSLSVLETLVQSIVEKESYLNYYQTELEWDIQGFPVLILVDNGMDYRSKAVRNFCLDYDIILEFAPLRKAKYKTFIENWFEVMRKGLEEEFQGYGFRPHLKKLIENRDLKPEKEAVVTRNELEKILASWILDNYHITNKYDDYVPAPIIKWLEIQEGRQKFAPKIILPTPREP